MKPKNLLSSALLLPLGLLETAHALESDVIPETKAPRFAAVNHSLVLSHTHSELPVDSTPSTVAPFSASGAQHQSESYSVFVIPLETGFRLVGQPTPTFRVMTDMPLASLYEPSYELETSQMMYGFTPNVDRLTETLSQLDLPAAQLAAIRQTALEGKRQAIGWRAANLHFTRERLEMLGMSFRPPD